jgi:hypothetical protein
MLYKITGDTGKGRAGCGHLVRACEDYFIRVEGKSMLTALCKKCAGNSKEYNIIKVPQDLVDGCIPLR